MKVLWTNEAERSFNSILDFLLEHWTSREANTFIELVNNVIVQIQANPEMFKISGYDRHYREAVITKHTTMFYTLNKTTIEIAYFWGNYRHPGKLKDILEY